MRFIVERQEGVYFLTGKAMDLINFFAQFFTISFALVVGLLTLIIVLIIFK